MIDLEKFRRENTSISVFQIDSSAKFLENSSLFLHKFFDDVTTSSDGIDALEILKIIPCDILITDIELPNINGIEFIQEVKKISPKTQIIVITMHDSKENLLELLSLNISKLLTKPIHAPSLFEALIGVVAEINKQKLATLSKEKVDEGLDEKDSIIQLLKNLKSSREPIQLHNYYKGLSITNNAYIEDIGDNHITFKTNNMQQKAIQYETKTLAVSELFDSALLCKNILKLEFNSELIEFKDFSLQKTSPITRKTVRVSVNNEHTVILSVNEHLFQGDISISDISVDAVKLNLDALPAGLHKDENSINITIIIKNAMELLELSASAKYLREDENDSSYSVVFLLNFEVGQRSALIKEPLANLNPESFKNQYRLRKLN
jgi:YesN/AraC family two-component response regulator